MRTPKLASVRNDARITACTGGTLTMCDGTVVPIAGNCTESETTCDVYGPGAPPVIVNACPADVGAGD